MNSSLRTNVIINIHKLDDMLCTKELLIGLQDHQFRLISKMLELRNSEISQAITNSIDTMLI